MQYLKLISTYATSIVHNTPQGDVQDLTRILIAIEAIRYLFVYKVGMYAVVMEPDLMYKSTYRGLILQLVYEIAKTEVKNSK